jgi:FkbM family methyltransferase
MHGQASYGQDDRGALTASGEHLTPELDSLLGTDRAALVAREEGLFDELTAGASGPLVLVGAGGLGRKTLAGLRETRLAPVCLADNDSRLHGRTVDGLPVMSVDAATAQYGQDGVFVVTVFLGGASVEAQLQRLGCRTVVPFFVLYWKFPERFLPHYAYGLPHEIVDAAPLIRRAWTLLDDRTSRLEYLAQVRWRLDPFVDALPRPDDGDMYFAQDIVTLSTHEVFIDCGGYDGDTALDLVARTGGRFSRLYVFEPDPGNYARLEEALTSVPPRIRRRIVTQAIAVGREPGRVTMHLSGAASSIAGGEGVSIGCEPLDRLLEASVPTFIKMDIEGAEMDALEGAKKTIATHQPVLAVSAYHRPDDLWTIPLYVHSLAGRYRFHYRRYSHFAIDDLVLYAVAREPEVASANRVTGPEGEVSRS